MGKFDIMQSSPLADPMAVRPSFLISATNWKCESIQDICIRMLEVNCIYQAIYVQFGLKLRS